MEYGIVTMCECGGRRSEHPTNPAHYSVGCIEHLTRQLAALTLRVEQMAEVVALVSEVEQTATERTRQSVAELTLRVEALEEDAVDAALDEADEAIESAASASGVSVDEYLASPVRKAIDAVFDEECLRPTERKT